MGGEYFILEKKWLPFGSDTAKMTIKLWAWAPKPFKVAAKNSSIDKVFIGVKVYCFAINVTWLIIVWVCV